VNKHKSGLEKGRQAPVLRTAPSLIAEAPESLVASLVSDVAKMV